MRNYIYLLAVASMLLVACKDDEKKKNASSAQEPEQGQAPSEESFNLSNKGIGPIKELALGELNQTLVAEGESLFKKTCTACHMIDRKLIGPALKGVLKKRSPEWAMNLILNTEQMLNEDPDAKQLLETYQTPMLSQGLTESEARAVLEYLRTI